MILNSTITILKVVIGLISGSLALLSDVGHNFSDILSLALGYFGSSYSKKQPTKKHTFGYKR
ncbi:cation transporter, partial [archaeon SCG-AAA382B04]